jgi:hypothetical protein
MLVSDFDLGFEDFAWVGGAIGAAEEELFEETKLRKKLGKKTLEEELNPDVNDVGDGLDDCF